MKIFKYPVTITDTFSVDMPERSEVLTVQTQHGTPQMWALVDPNYMPKRRTFHVRGTGHSFTGQEGQYIGTFQVADGDLVFHLFEDKANA